MTDKILLRMTEEGPYRYKDQHVSIGRGRAKLVPADHAKRLLEERDIFERCCGVEKHDGRLCSEPFGDCRYHQNNDTEVTEDESED